MLVEDKERRKAIRINDDCKKERREDEVVERRHR